MVKIQYTSLIRNMTVMGQNKSTIGSGNSE